MLPIASTAASQRQKLTLRPVCSSVLQVPPTPACDSSSVGDHALAAGSSNSREWRHGRQDSALLATAKRATQFDTLAGAMLDGLQLPRFSSSQG